jgi:hypothetical protein
MTLAFSGIYLQKNRYYFLVMLLAFFCKTLSSQTTGNVFFFGIGIENSKVPGAPIKPLAKADVSAVYEKTKNDLLNNHISYYSSELNKQIRFNDVIPSFLFDDKASLENIDSVFSEIGKKANPYDIFYFYISAPDNSSNGAFYLPAKPQKKGAKVSDTPVMLEATKLQAFFSRISCRNQLILADAQSWKVLHGTLLSFFAESADKEKNKLFIVPSSLVTDTFLVDGNKQLSLFSAVICKTELCLLFSFEEDGTTEAEFQLGLTAAGLTNRKQKYLIFYAPLRIENAGALMATSTPSISSAASIAGDKSPAAKVVSKNNPVKTAPVVRGPVHPEIEKVITDSIVGLIRNYALIIGESDYHDSAWHDLPNPVSDASALNDELKNHYGFETSYLENPTKAEIWKALSSLSTLNFDQNSQVLIFFAGHGGMNAIDGYLVPSDGKSSASDPEMNSFITYGTLWRIVKGIPSQHVLVLLDACYSGTFDEDVLVNRSEADATAKDLDKVRLISQKMKYKFKGYISSGGKDPVSDGIPGGHSPFMNNILDCLRNGYATNEIVTYTDLSAKLGKMTTPPPVSKMIAGEPGGDFLFIPQDKKKK